MTLTSAQLDLILRVLDRRWNELDRQRASTPYPDDKPILDQQQEVTDAMSAIRAMKGSANV